MTILLPALAVAFAAFCVWLTVRVVNRRERWAKQTLTIAVTVMVWPIIAGAILWLAHFGILQRLVDLLP